MTAKKAMPATHLSEAWSKGPELNILPCFPATLLDVIRNANVIAPRKGILYVDGQGREDLQTYGVLLEEASRMLGALRERGLKPGDQIVLQIEDDRLFLTAFWAGVLGGFIPIPLALPNSFPISEGSEKITKVCQLLERAYIVTDQSVEAYQGLNCVAVFPVCACLGHAPDTGYHQPAPDDCAYIQFSSGSTGDPKGVVLTHRNLLTNIYAILQASANKEQHALMEDLFGHPPRFFDHPFATCSWLPYSHDMGLIGFHLTPLAAGMLEIKMTTTTFVVNPTLNLILIDKYRVTQIPSPNFGLLWMIYMVKDESIKGIDLSCVEVLYNGAEPISPPTVRLFANRFSAYGFNPQAMFPVYGMAEAALLVSAPPVGTSTVYHVIDRETFAKQHMVMDPKGDDPTIEFVDEGYPALGMEIRVVDEQDICVKEGGVGHIQIQGPNVTRGYYRHPEANRELFCGEWLRTGDLGFIKGGRLTVTGRYKDVIFLNGKNYYSHDIEEELQSLPFLGFKNMAICGVMDQQQGGEKIVLFLKTKRSQEDLLDLLVKINEHISKKIKGGIDAIVPMHDIPRTTSGKVQRYVLRERYEAGDFIDREVRRMERIWSVGHGSAADTPSSEEHAAARHINLQGLVEELPFAMAEGVAFQPLPRVIRTLPEVLKIASILSPQEGILHVEGEGHEYLQTYSALLHAAECVLGGLRSRRLKPGDQVILQIEQPREFLAAFWGIVLGGFIPVPLPIPGGFPISEGMERITRVCTVLDRVSIVTDQSAANYRVLGDIRIFAVHDLLEHAPDREHHKPKPDDIAYLQFSSGSTGEPKGVILTHRNLLYTIDASAKGTLDVRGHDIRPLLGFGMHILRRKLGGKRAHGVLETVGGLLERSGLADIMRRSPLSKHMLDTLLILGGRRISPYLDMRFDDIKIVNWMPYSHDMGLIGFHLAPTLGGMDQIKLEPRTFIQNPALFLRLIDRYRASHVPCPNFAVQWLTTQVDEAEIQGIDLSCIKMLGNGSEPISPAVTRAFIEKFSRFGFDPRAMYMAYGMAEASLQVTNPPVFEEAVFHKVDKDVFLRDQIVLPTHDDLNSMELTDVGSPAAGLRIRIVDENDRLVHENTVGHIQIQGPSVVRGYFNNPEANQDLFCDGWLRTGDMGFMRGGRITITGRRKDIIFVNGQNLYAHDIEEHIKRVPGMAFKEFAVAGLRHGDSEKVILFIRAEESPTALAALLARINTALVASVGIKIDFIVPVTEIPRTPSAKVKRHRLREQFEQGFYRQIVALDEVVQEQAGTRDEDGQDLSDLERRTIAIWREILGVDAIGKLDNFFDLGGNSLRATKVASRLRDEFGLDIPLRTLFEFQTVAELADAIGALLADARAEFPPIAPLTPQPYYEASHAQRRLWLLDKIVPGSPFYNIPGAVLLDNIELDLTYLKRALQAVVDRHETLRTVFKTVADAPVQVIADSLPLDMPIIDLARKKDKEGSLRAIIEEQKRAPFNLETGPLFRLTVVRLSKTRHAFIIILHHIIADGWSMALLVQEAVGNYLACLEDKPSPFPALAVQYRDYAAWQNLILSGEAILRQEAYWVENLQAPLPVLNLPTDRPRPAVQTQNQATLRAHIDQELAFKLREIARREDVTPFMLTLAMFKVLLHKLSGQDDIIIGAPIAGRNNAQIEPLIGFFVNVLPMRSSLAGDPIFKDYLAAVKQTALAAYANQDYPFDRLVEVVNPARDVSRSPVFDLTFEFRELSANPFAQLSQSTFKIQNITGDDPHSKFDMSVTVDETDTGLDIRFEYNADLFDAATIQRFMGYYRRVMQELLADPHQRISAVPMLPEEERRRILDDFNATQAAFPDGTCIHTLFSAQAARTPDQTALVFSDRIITYARLEHQTNALARRMRDQGVKPGDLVGILSPRCPEMIMGQLAVWKTGAAFVPIDPDYPRERIRYLLEDAQARILLTRQALRDLAPDDGIPVICLDDAAIWEGGDAPCAPAIAADARAYVVYTSGSTGRPKGAMISHQTFANLLSWHVDTFGVTAADRASNLAGVAFDASLWEVWPYLITGASVVTLERGLGQMTPEELSVWFTTNGITRAFVPTKFAEVFIGMDFPGLPLKTLFTGGDRLSHVAKRQAYAVINCYGPTECTVLCTSADVSDWRKGSPPIGRPIHNAKIYILDRYRQVVPVGVVGELFIGGVPTGLGYLNDPEKTGQTFIPNPFGAPDERIYATGDLARWLADGTIEFIGRTDFQVEIRGYRVELGEIEAALSHCPAVQECVVLDRQDEKGGVRLAAFYVAEQPLAVDTLQSFLREQLPGYMIPSRFIHLAAFPLTPNGKMDRNALSAMLDKEMGLVQAYVAPRDTVEAKFAQVWQEILRLEKVGIYDNFFDLGGDSIISLQVVSKLARQGIRIQPRDILQHQTIAELIHVAEVGESVSAEQGPVTGEAPLTPIQRWFFDQAFARVDHFNQALLFASSARLDAAHLRQALAALLNHHDSLRARFVDGRQVYPPVGEEPYLLEKDIAGQAALEAEVRGLQAAFDIVHGPVFGAGLFHGPEEDWLLLAAHHLVVDGVSWRILMEDLLTGYATLAAGGTLVLPEKTTAFRDWALKLAAYAQTAAVQDELPYWASEVAVLGEIPVDHDRGVNDSASAQTVAVELDEEATGHLIKDANAAYHTEVNDLLIAALAKSLSSWTDRPAVAFDLEAHGREDLLDGVDISRTVGWFTTLYPVAVTLNGSDLADQIKQVKEKLHTIPHKGFNYGVLRYLAGADLAARPGISFNYLGQIAPAGGAVRLVTTQAPGTIARENVRPHLIDINGMVVDGRLQIEIMYSPHKHRRENIQRLATLFIDELAAVIGHCLNPESFDITPSDFELAGLDQAALDKLTDFE